MIVEIEGRRIEFDRPEKWVWYDSGYTITDLARYYTAVSPWLLPYLARRPIVYETYKGTINGPQSFEQDPPPQTPRWVKRTPIRGHERIVTYVIVDSAAALVYLVSLFMVSVHVWQSTLSAIEKPDFLLIDLDPCEGCTVAQLARAALRVREVLREYGIEDVLVKSSGARGLHVVAFIKPEYEYKIVREAAHRLALVLEHRYPEQFTAQREPRRRALGTIYIDWGQVGRGMTIVPPFSARSCEGAPVSMPLHWREIERLALSRSKKPTLEYFKRYNIGNAVDLLKKDGDPWAGRRNASLAPLIAASH